MAEWLNTLVYGLVLAAVACGSARPRLFDARWRGRIWGAALVGLAGLAAVRATGADASALLATRPETAGRIVGLAREMAPAVAGDGWIRIPALPVPAALLLLAWASVAAVRILVLALAVVRIRAARVASRPFPAARSARLPKWTAANRGRFPLVVSDRIGVPSMLGFGRPMVAVPTAWHDRVPDATLDAVLIHELAHAERRDDLFELAQQLVTAGCWFHPAAWWIARRIAFEREAACDERAACLTTTRRYAQSLLRIAEAMQAASVRPRVLVASSGVRRRDLARRIARLVARDGRSAVPTRPGLATTAMASIVALAVAAPALPRVFDVDDVRSTPVVDRQPAVASQAPERVETAARAGGGRTPRPEGIGRRRAVIIDAPAIRTGAASMEVQLDAAAPPPATVEGSLASRDWGVHVLPSVGPEPAALPASPESGNVEGRTGRFAGFGALGSAFSRAGAGTGRWFSRAGTSVASAISSR